MTEDHNVLENGKNLIQPRDQETFSGDDPTLSLTEESGKPEGRTLLHSKQRGHLRSKKTQNKTVCFR